MPYINQSRRREIDFKYNELLEIAGNLTDGDINYIISNLLNRRIEQKGVSYTVCNSIVGILECAKMEFYNKLVTSYENIKIAENGGLYKELNSDLVTLKSEHAKVKNELESYKLIESLHDCDSWRDVFTQNRNTLNDKVDAIEVAFENFVDQNGLHEKIIGICTVDKKE
jgi:hypothetical protein